MIKMFTPYNHLPNYLHRWQLAKLWKLKVRVHQILSPDSTPFLHTHPFNYLSLIMSGGYTEQVVENGQIIQKSYTPGSVVCHKASTYHRILTVLPNTTTLFFAWDVTRAGEQGWQLTRHCDVVSPPEYVDHPDGLYWTGTGYRKRKDGKWYALQQSAATAMQCDRLSIHQQLSREEHHALDFTKQLVQ